MDDDYSPETRQDRITKQWVAFAPTRRERPHRTASDARPETDDDDAPVEGCPFCPGHEAMLPSVLWELGGGPNRPWRTRAVPNKFPALTPTAPSPSNPASSLYASQPSRGRQEVIIETPAHHRSPAQFTTHEMDGLLRTYLARYRAIRQADGGLLPVLFRNHGAAAGASIDHPHSQLMALSFDPPHLQREEAAAEARYDEHGRCPYCAMIDAELQAEDRLVRTTDDFVLFTPYAAREPYEMWILPRRHEPEVGRMTDAERRALANVLQDALWRLDVCLDDPDYNYFFRTALTYESDAPYLHWTLRIRPRLSVDAGFEQCTDVRVNPSIPERDAAVLRAAG
ncbi:MAG: galactose-1-phosphate uridylyltransferase [Salinibacter sp.]